jgi:hypothetical protein
MLVTVPDGKFVNGPLTGPTWSRTAAASSTDQRTYQLIRQAGPIAARSFEIEFLDAGVDACGVSFG